MVTRSWRAPSFLSPLLSIRRLLRTMPPPETAPVAMAAAWITGPASNPLSFLNGPAYRTTGQNMPYDFPDFAPMTALDRQLPPWIGFGLEERFRAEGMFNQSFKANVDDSYLLNRMRFLMQIKPTHWLRIVGQVQDARAWFPNATSPAP